MELNIYQIIYITAGMSVHKLKKLDEINIIQKEGQ